MGDRNRPWLRRAFWVQAEVVAVATDLAEIVGGSLALNLLFGLPVVVGAVVTTAVSTAHSSAAEEDRPAPEGTSEVSTRSAPRTG